MKLNVEYSLEMDLRNYTQIFLEDQSYSYGRKDEINGFLKGLPKEIGKIVRSKNSKDEKISKLEKFLENRYEEKGELFRGNASKLERKWRESGNQIIYLLESFYDKKFPYKKVTAYVTTNVVCPYNPEKKYFYVRWLQYDTQLCTANHELNHFMFHHHYPHLEEEIGNEKWHILKESLTFFTEPNNPGYPAEQELRKLYLSRKWKNVDEIIKAGKNVLLK